MITRRALMNWGLYSGAAVLLGRWVHAAESAPRAALPAQVASSALIYVTPLHQDGAESSCQAEIWFVSDGEALYVVTASDAWRARAVRRGLTGARIWVGDVGNWQSSDGKYRELPELQARAALVDDARQHERILALFGSKYRMEWLLWGPRFRNGLKEGSRVMVQYRPV